MDAQAVLALDDAPFQDAWRALTSEERSAIGELGFTRYRELTAYVDAGIERIRREQAHDENNGHEFAIVPGIGSVEIPAEQQERSPRYPLDWCALEQLSPDERQWAIHGWIGMGHVTLMVGAGGIGKSLLAQQLASCVALGHNFIDQVPTERRTLVWACEDDHDEIWRRQLMIAQWMKTPLSAFAPSLVIEPRHGRDNTMVSTEFGRPMFTGLIDELAAQANDYQSELVIIDNAAQVYGASENDRHAVTMFLNGLSGRLKNRAVLVLAHPSRATGSEFSGSSAWEAVARTRLYLGRSLPDQPQEDEPLETTRYLARRKANYGARDYRKFEFNNGVLIQDQTEGDTGLLHSIKSKKASRVVIDGLRRLTELQVRTTDGKTSPSYLPRTLADYKLTEGLTMRELGDAMRTAMLSGQVERGVIGKYENRTPMYGLKLTGNGSDDDAQT